MIEEYSKVNLNNVGNGAAPELFDRELAVVMKNVMDPNTDPTAARKILMEITIKPEETRETGNVTVKFRSVLAGVRPVRAAIFMVKDERGKTVAHHHNYKQEAMDFAAATVTPYTETQMIKEAIEKILSLAVDEKILSISGREFHTRNLIETVPRTPITLKVNTFGAIVDYVRKDIDKLASECFVHVASPDLVRLYGEMDTLYMTREIFIDSVREQHADEFEFGEYMGVEEFIVGVLSQFEETKDRAVILALAGNLSAEKVVNAIDDGVSQTVGTKLGVALKGTAKIKNPVKLAPYRTFLEVTQPLSDFIFRVKQRDNEVPACALFEADGGAWRMEAILKIAKFLEAEKLPIPVIS